jgi:hypothetical protein
MEGFECSMLLEGVSYQFIQDIEESIPKCSAFLAADSLRRRYWSGHAGDWAGGL